MQMSESPVVELLASQTNEFLDAADEQAAERIKSANADRALIAHARALKAGRADLTPHAGLNGPGPSTKPKPGRRNNRGMILRIMQTDPSRVWMPANVYQALREEGIKTTVDAVRQAMRRLGIEEHVLERGEDGNGWKLASPNGSPSELFGEAPSSGPEG